MVFSFRFPNRTHAEYYYISPRTHIHTCAPFRYTRYRCGQLLLYYCVIVPYLWIASKVLWTKKLRSLKCYRCIPHRYRGCANSLQQTRKKNMKMCTSCAGVLQVKGTTNTILSSRLGRRTRDGRRQAVEISG